MAEVILLCGRTGADKNAYANQLKNQLNAVLLSCDELIFTLYEDRFGMKHNPVLQKSKLYQVHLAEQIVGTGTNVILDLEFWSAHERRTITQYLAEKGIKTQLHYIKRTEETWDKAGNHPIDRKNTYFVDNIVKNLFSEPFDEPDDDEVDVLLIKNP